MKKSLFFTLALLLLCAFLFACGETPAESGTSAATTELSTEATTEATTEETTEVTTEPSATTAATTSTTEFSVTTEAVTEPDVEEKLYTVELTGVTSRIYAFSDCMSFCRKSTITFSADTNWIANRDLTWQDDYSGIFKTEDGSAELRVRRKVYECTAAYSPRAVAEYYGTLDAARTDVTTGTNAFGYPYALWVNPNPDKTEWGSVLLKYSDDGAVLVSVSAPSGESTALLLEAAERLSVDGAVLYETPTAPENAEKTVRRTTVCGCVTSNEYAGADGPYDLTFSVPDTWQEMEQNSRCGRLFGVMPSAAETTVRDAAAFRYGCVGFDAVYQPQQIFPELEYAFDETLIQKLLEVRGANPILRRISERPEYIESGSGTTPNGRQYIWYGRGIKAYYAFECVCYAELTPGTVISFYYLTDIERRDEMLDLIDSLAYGKEPDPSSVALTQAQRLTEQIITFMLEEEQLGNVYAAEDKDIYQFLVTLIWYADAPTHPYGDIVKRSDDGMTWSLSLADAQRAAAELFGRTDWTQDSFSNESFDDAAQCYRFNIGVGHRTSAFDYKNMRVKVTDDAVCVTCRLVNSTRYEYPACDYGDYTFVFRRESADGREFLRFIGTEAAAS